MSIPDPLSQHTLILASRSPRRSELLQQAGFRFIVDPADDAVEAGCCTDRPPARLVAELSLAKALDVATREPWRNRPGSLILGADTVAECDGRILGKPANEDHAREMLQFLSGRKHRVLTGVSLVLSSTSSDLTPRSLTRVEQTWLMMDRLSPPDLEEYLASDRWIGKAGAFGYQDGPDWLHVLEGLESNVVGLPVERLEPWIQELLEQAN